MEELNKTQIVLVTLLVSFVTSIATGIVTVTLMDQAPPGLTHTISKVVEHTVERVVPEKVENAAAVSTVIIKEENIIQDVIQKTGRGVIRIYDAVETKGDNGIVALEKKGFVATGFIVSNQGLVLTDADLISDTGLYVGELSEGTVLHALVVGQNEIDGIALLRLEQGAEETVLPPIAFGDAETLNLGQRVIAIGGPGKGTASVGVVSTIEEKIGSEGEVSHDVYRIRTVLAPSPFPGSPLFDVQGSVIGMNRVKDGQSFALAAHILMDAVATLSATTTRAQ